jgi:hypothetical protein
MRGSFRKLYAQVYRVFAPPLRHHVPDIIGIRTKEKVFWVTARRIVTAVKHKQPFIERAMVKLVANAVRLHVNSRSLAVE